MQYIKYCACQIELRFVPNLARAWAFSMAGSRDFKSETLATDLCLRITAHSKRRPFRFNDE